MVHDPNTVKLINQAIEPLQKEIAILRKLVELLTKEVESKRTTL